MGARLGQNQGTSNFKAKLDEEDVIEIFTSDLSQTLLAQKFGMSQGGINHIKTGRTWSHITRGLDKGVKTGGYKLSREQIRRIYVAKGTLVEIARKFGIAFSLVSMIKTGRMHRDVTGAKKKARS